MHSNKNLIDKIEKLESSHKNSFCNISRQEIIKQSIERKEAIPSQNGALATWTPTESTGRSPKDTYIVKNKESQNKIDWDSPNNIPLSPDTFLNLFEDAINTLEKSNALFITKRAVGARSNYSLPVYTFANKALTALFTDNVFRPLAEDITNSCFAEKPFYLLVCPYNKLDAQKYKGQLRTEPKTNKTSTMAIVMNFDLRIGIVYGSAYGGSVKKLLFTVMNYMLPEEGILPIHCSANEGKNNDTALMLGLSGTGKTSLSSDPERALLGDDEHGWCNEGIANFENGCYAKMIDINPEKEKEIYNAVMHTAKPENHGAIIENAMMYPDGTFDFFDDRLTQNSRASYPLTFLTNIKASSIGTHPKTILFLTADANGVLPPVAKLSQNQAMLWFLMGYTSKLAGTETGIVEPTSTFSRFFGAPFMPCNPNVYARMLGEKLDKYKTTTYLINTGWTGGPYGIGKRIDISLTRKMVHAALSGELKDIEYKQDLLFHLAIPKTCPGISDNSILFPENTWQDKTAFKERASKLAKDFSSYFDKTYGNKNIAQEIAQECPGK